MKQRTIDRKASNTAGYTCFSRACATRERSEQLRGPDDMAEIFLPVFAKVLLNVPALRKFFMRKIAPLGIYEYVIARTKVLDECFVDALEHGFRQIVLLGAGMDTRALRFADQNQGTKIYELDVRTTQQPKLEILKRKHVALPEELVFVPIDFNKENLADVLIRAGYREQQQSLFLWEGVTMYLNADAVDRTLDFIRTSARVGSIVVFDYIYASVLRKENTRYGEAEIFNRVSKAGEGWTFGVEAGEIEPFLSARGFQMTAHHTPRQLEQRYLTTEEGHLLARINGTHCIAIAEAH
ncbi:MAG: SAM-dependent methyltransferase [Anaerolineales bacterium]|nr:SAM-dependent methyltransferase [Anaerolineales bacterium]